LNKHITDNINYYLSLNKPEYAILLSGKWGAGKTYFIDKFINSYSEIKTDKAIKKQFIKISLFGLKEVSSIDEQIFQNLHPILASKYAKLTGNILKSALKLGVSFDFNGDGKKDRELSANLDNFNLLEFFTDKEKNKELVFIFDDLERTSISIKEIFGYINYLVEQSSFKVILIANEDKLHEKEENTYLEFKEKVIGKTFEVRHNFNEVLGSFLKDNPIQLDKSIIINVYNIANYKNLRHIKQLIIDFIYIVKKISKSYLNNEEFLSKFGYIFFSLYIEVKNGTLDEELFLSHKKSNEILKKYNLGYDFILPKSVWIKILYKGYIEGDELNNIIGNLSFFIREEEKPLWVKLWHYGDIEDDDFQELLENIIVEFKNCSFETLGQLLHTVALLIYFYNNEISTLCVEEIKQQVKKCLSSKHSETKHWNKPLLKNSIRFNGTGLGYINDNDTDFVEIFDEVIESNKKIYNSNVIINEKEMLENAINAISNNEIEFIENTLLGDKEYLPILANQDSEKFFNAIINSSNKTLSELFQIINSRYSSNKTLDGKGYGFYLRDELKFWQDLKDKFECFDYAEFKIKRLILQEFKKFIIDKIITKMSNYEQ
jgi:hypothetical protein